MEVAKYILWSVIWTNLWIKTKQNKTKTQLFILLTACYIRYIHISHISHISWVVVVAQEVQQLVH